MHDSLLSGHVSYCVTLLMYLGLLALVLTLSRALLRHRIAKAAVDTDKQLSPSKSASDTLSRPSLLSYVVVYICFAGFNFTITACANVSYVYVVLNERDSLLFMAQILLSLFKFALNSLCSPY